MRPLPSLVPIFTEALPFALSADGAFSSAGWAIVGRATRTTEEDSSAVVKMARRQRARAEFSAIPGAGYNTLARRGASMWRATLVGRCTRLLRHGTSEEPCAPVHVTPRSRALKGLSRGRPAYRKSAWEGRFR